MWGGIGLILEQMPPYKNARNAKYFYFLSSYLKCKNSEVKLLLIWGEESGFRILERNRNINRVKIIKVIRKIRKI